MIDQKLMFPSKLSLSCVIPSTIFKANNSNKSCCETQLYCASAFGIENNNSCTFKSEL